MKNLLKDKTFLIFIGVVALIVWFQWWKKKNSNGSVLASLPTANGTVNGAFLSEVLEPTTGTRAEGDRSKTMGMVLCGPGQYYDKSCQCCITEGIM